MMSQPFVSQPFVQQPFISQPFISQPGPIFGPPVRIWRGPIIYGPIHYGPPIITQPTPLVMPPPLQQGDGAAESVPVPPLETIPKKAAPMLQDR